jgi:predicted nuclease with TOPRIM domain
VDHRWQLQDYELIAQELSSLAEKVSDLRERLTDVEKVNARLEEAALITARALQEISGHWDAVYEAMRRRNSSDEASTDSRDDWHPREN